MAFFPHRIACIHHDPRRTTHAALTLSHGIRGQWPADEVMHCSADFNTRKRRHWTVARLYSAIRGTRVHDGDTSHSATAGVVVREGRCFPRGLAKVWPATQIVAVPNSERLRLDHLTHLRQSEG